VLFESPAAFEGAGTKGLENRDLVGLEVGVAIVAAAATTLPFFATASPPAGLSESGETLVQGKL
jgi:hypothetical protein